MIVLQMLATLRKTAQELTREYIRRRVQERLLHQLTVIGIELSLFAGALIWHNTSPSLASALFASVVLWGVTLYNLFDLFFATLPELASVHRFLRSKTGYAMKQILEVSLVTELMHLNIVLLTACLIVGIGSRTVMGLQFSYTRPWQHLASSAIAHEKTPLRKPRTVTPR